MADEMSYDRFWHRTFNVSLHWMVCMLAFAVLISGIFTLDGEKGLLRIYRVTKTGERGLFLSKLKSVLALGLPVYAAVLLPDLIRLFRISQEAHSFVTLFMRHAAGSSSRRWSLTRKK